MLAVSEIPRGRRGPDTHEHVRYYEGQNDPSRPTAKLRALLEDGHPSTSPRVGLELDRLDRFFAKVMDIHSACDKARKDQLAEWATRTRMGLPIKQNDAVQERPETLHQDAPQQQSQPPAQTKLRLTH